MYLSSGCYCWVGRKGTCTGMELFSSVHWLFRESCSKSPDIVFPLKSILVRVFQNHKLRVKIKNMFSWCSERQDLAQIRTIFPHSSCQEHYLKIANWLALIFPFFFFKMTLLCFEDMFLHIKMKAGQNSSLVFLGLNQHHIEHEVFTSPWPMQSRLRSPGSTFSDPW